LEKDRINQLDSKIDRIIVRWENFWSTPLEWINNISYWMKVHNIPFHYTFMDVGFTILAPFSICRSLVTDILEIIQNIYTHEYYKKEG